LRYFHDVRRRLVRAVGGDRACGIQNIAAKNPFFPGNTAVRYASGPCTLADLRLEPAPEDAPLWRTLEYAEGTRYSARLRAEKCAEAIAVALDALALAGRKLTGQAIADAVGVGIRTVRRLLTIQDGCVAWKKERRPKSVG